MAIPVQRHAPRTLDDHVVAYLENEENCAKPVALIPPPDSCSPGVHAAYGILKFQPLTVIIVLFFIFMLIKMTMGVLGGDEHH
jgi:hypothetical protein